MPTRLRWLAVALLAGLVIGGGIVTWQYWPVALRYRQKRTEDAGRAAVRRYVEGRDSLSHVACELASEIRKLNELSFKLAAAERGSRRRIFDQPRFVPLGANANDPRVVEVTLNAYRATAPDWIPSSDRIRITQWYDSTLRARGLRVVQCAA